MDPCGSKAVCRRFAKLHWKTKSYSAIPVSQLSHVKSRNLNLQVLRIFTIEASICIDHTQTHTFWYAIVDLFLRKLCLHTVRVHVNPSPAQIEPAASAESKTSVLLYDSVIVLQYIWDLWETKQWPHEGSDRLGIGYYNLKDNGGGGVYKSSIQIMMN